MAQQTYARHSGEPDTLDDGGLCLLSLDGGGVRGLSSLLILKGIMDRLNTARKESGLAVVKPCEVFDLIGGTSTGGLIAIMLGRLQMSVDQCIKAYCELAESVFGKPLHKTQIDWKTNIKPIFDCKRLDEAVKNVVVASGASEDALLDDGMDRGCKTFVCTMDKTTKHMVRLRDYKLSHEPALNPAPTIREAARATTAATTFFEPATIGRRTFVDGGLGANNPVGQVEGEASNIWCPETSDLKPMVKCFISVGTGHPGLKPIEDGLWGFLSRTLVDIATETEETEREFVARWARHLGEKRYYRFNVEQGLQDIRLDEHEKLGAIEAATELYLTHIKEKFRVRDCIANLKQKQPVCVEDFS